MAAPEAAEPRRVFASLAGLERGVLVRTVVIAVLIVFALLGLPVLLGTYWLTVCTAVAVYSIVAARCRSPPRTRRAWSRCARSR